MARSRAVSSTMPPVSRSSGAAAWSPRGGAQVDAALGDGMGSDEVQVFPGGPGERVPRPESLMTVGERALVLGDRIRQLAGQVVGQRQFTAGGDRVPVPGALHAFPVGEGTPVMLDRVLGLLGGAVGQGEACPGGDRVEVV